MQQKLRHILQLGTKLLFVALVFVLLGFVAVKNSTQRIGSLSVFVDQKDNIFFVDAEAVRAKLLNESDSLFGVLTKNIDLIDLEQKILNIPHVEKARVYHTIKGDLAVEIKQKLPIARIIFNNGSSSYLCDKGTLFPVSSQYAARVLVVTGHIKPVNQIVENEIHNPKDILKEINKLSRFIASSPFWSAQIMQVYVNGKQEFELIPRVGGHVIEIGSTVNLEKKMKKLEIFYTNGLSKTDWNAYKTINVKYKDQIVCTKK
ncbi:MAG: cell division protein FtsQ/DivIB [Luteibaculaceae bacterium]